MKLLKEFDYKDYKLDGTVGVRPSARAIIIRDDKLALVYSEKYDYYIFAGGGIDEGESKETALIREIREETGLDVIPESIKEYGLIVRREHGKIDDLFIQENYFYLCDVSDKVLPQKLDNYEAEERYILRWVTPQEAIETNMNHSHIKQENATFCARLMERETWLMERLISEGYFR
ncbi:MAG: NUDIX domain-containing protein [Lachnospiraceae bacterium]|nr:NUDIX domain-containing protein [Lachnospiraceae bacterium]